MLGKDKTMYTRRYPARGIFLILLILSSVLLAGCGMPFSMPFMKDPGVASEVRLKILSVSAKIVFAAGTAVLEVLLDELPIKIDDDDLISQLVQDRKALTGAPPSDGPIIMVVNKRSNDLLYWKLSDNIKEIRLKHGNPGAIELKVKNESPLRVELWIEGDLKEISVEFELKE